jgi:hypothetical protein
MGTQAGCAVTTFCLFLYYVWSNKKRASANKVTEEAYMAPETWTTMTDKENKMFRYTY